MSERSRISKTYVPVLVAWFERLTRDLLWFAIERALQAQGSNIQGAHALGRPTAACEPFKTSPFKVWKSPESIQSRLQHLRLAVQRQRALHMSCVDYSWFAHDDEVEPKVHEGVTYENARTPRRTEGKRCFCCFCCCCCCC